jgi:hypothetical protein
LPLADLGEVNRLLDKLCDIAEREFEVVFEDMGICDNPSHFISCKLLED